MRSVASVIIMTAVAFVAVRFVSSNAPQSRHAAVWPFWSTQYIAVPRYTRAYRYGAPARRPHSRSQRLLADYLRARALLSLLSPRTTAATPLTPPTSPAVTEKSTTTTTTTTTMSTTPETCSGLSEVPEAYQGWFQYKGCCYQAGDSPDAFGDSKLACSGAARLANQNVRSAADRKALFVDLLELSGDVWMDLYDDGGGLVGTLVWETGAGQPEAYVDDGVTTFEGSRVQSVAATYSTDDPNVLTFRDSNYVFGGTEVLYVCEFCP